MSDKIIVFYSRADENYVNGQLKVLEKGNTEAAAEIIEKLTGADMFKIEQTEPYAKGYNECIEQARSDRNNNARPRLKAYPESLDGYGTIYLGFPNYWGTMPMAVFTFLERFNLDGKVIKPFCTHEGSGMGDSVKDIRKICPAAKVEKGLAIRGSQVGKSEKEIEQWIKE
ncbi:MAG TPA: flavodoxin [Ruminococcaceae bacterium]|nr:flavodoxin [Oscillospiraceae bacterium]